MRAYRIACKPRLDVSRCFSTARSSRQLKLAYDLHEPPQDGGPVNNPIIFIHGLFGSKKNNRSMSKYGGPSDAFNKDQRLREAQGICKGPPPTRLRNSTNSLPRPLLTLSSPSASGPPQPRRLPP